MLYWTYESKAHEQAGALPPVPMNLDYGRQVPSSPFRSRDYAERWRAVEAGYRVVPADCPPIRFTSRYGLCIRCPANAWFRRASQVHAERVFEDDRAAYGATELGGAPWPRSDSGFVASWIAGSEYVKLQTGLRLFYPAGWCLFQGPLPNAQLLDGHAVEVMTGIEPASRARRVELGGREHGVADLNLICRLPPAGATVTLSAGTPVAWVFAVPPSPEIAIVPLGEDHA